MQKCHIAINDNQFLYFFQKKVWLVLFTQNTNKAGNGILEGVSVAWYNSTSFYDAIVSFFRKPFTPETFMQVPSVKHKIIVMWMVDMETLLTVHIQQVERCG